MLDRSDEELVALQAVIIFAEQLLCQAFDVYPDAFHHHVVYPSVPWEGSNGTHPIHTKLRKLASPMTEAERHERQGVYKARANRRRDAREAAQPELKTRRLLEHAEREQRRRDALTRRRERTTAPKCASIRRFCLMLAPSLEPFGGSAKPTKMR
jgi:hypothetical protein